MSNISWKVWLPVLAAFATGGLNAIVPVIPQPWAAIASIALSALAVYNHGNAVAVAGSINK